MSDKGSKGQVLSLLMDYPDATYVTIGSIVGRSKQRVHQIAKEAGLTRMRRPSHYRKDVATDKVLELYHRDLLIKEMAQYLRKPRMKKYRLIMFDACVRERSAYNMDYTLDFYPSGV